MASCVNCGSPLPSPTAECPNCATQVLPNTPTLQDVPQINGYDVVRRIGEGGMGSVYLAQELALNRRVAIKLISGKMATDAESRARFLREARSMATIEHANVIRVYAFGEVESMPYLAMEFVDGDTLADRIRRAGRLSVEDSVRLMRQVLLALEAAWEKGIVHRDIKPSNILLDRRDQVHVADFGLAKPASMGDDPVLTHSGHILGTPYYLSPEQAQGFATDFRSDIYSCGILFYEMLTGERPFEGTTPFAIVAKQIHEPLPPIKKKRPDVPSRVSKIIDLMTEKRPDRRPGSYAELIRLFDALLGITPSQPIIATQTMAASGRVSVDSKTLRRVAIGGGLLLVAILAVWSVFLVGKRNAARNARATDDRGMAVAVAPFYGPDDDSAKEGRLMAALIERSIAEKVGASNVRIFGVDQTKEPLRSHDEARALGQKLGASVVVWGDAFALKKETEIQPYFTFLPRKAPEPAKEEKQLASAASSLDQGEQPRESEAAALLNLAERRSETVKVQAEAPNQIEMRKTSAEGVGEMVSFLAAADAFYGRNDAKLALKFLEQAPHTSDTLRLRGLALSDIGHAEDKGYKGKVPEKALAAWTDAAAAFEQSIALDALDTQTHADLAETYLLLGRFKAAVAEYQRASTTATPYTTHYAIFRDGHLYEREVYRSEGNGSGKLDDSGYLLAVNPDDGIVAKRWRIPGIIRKFRPLERGFELEYADRSGSTEMRTLKFVDGRFDKPLIIGPNILLRMRGMKIGNVLAENFTEEFSGLIEKQPAKPRFRLRKVPFAGVPATLAELEAALREAARRDPTQPWHPFYLGQTLLAEGRRAEAEAVWNEMLRRDYSVVWSEWNWMAKTFQRFDQRSWADRFFERSLLERTKLPQPPQVTTLIDRLVAAPVVRMHPEQRKDADFAYSWFVRSRQLTGVAEGDNYQATAWARHFRRKGDLARARAEEEYVRRANHDPFNFAARDTFLDYASHFFVACWFAFIGSLLLLLRRANQRVVAAGSPTRLQLVVVASVAIVAFGLTGIVFGVGVTSLKGPAFVALVAMALLVAATAAAAPRILSLGSVIASIRPTERYVMLGAFGVFLAGSAVFSHTVNARSAMMEMVPLGISDSLGHPAMVRDLEKKLAMEPMKQLYYGFVDRPALLYVTAVANQLGGNIDRARQLYQMLPDDERARRALAAISSGRPILAFPTQREMRAAYSFSSYLPRPIPEGTLNGVVATFPLVIAVTFVAALLFFVLCCFIKPVEVAEAANVSSGVIRRWMRTAGLIALPGAYDVLRGSVLRGVAMLWLVGCTAVTVWAARIKALADGLPAAAGVGTWSVEGMSLSAQPLPPDVTSLDLLLSPPYAATFWSLCIAAAVVLIALHAMSLPAIIRVGRENRPSQSQLAPVAQPA